MCEFSRHVVVDKSLDSLDVKTTGGMVSGHQEVHFTVAKELQSPKMLYVRATPLVTSTNSSEIGNEKETLRGIVYVPDLASGRHALPQLSY